MATADAHEQRSFSNRDESDPMLNADQAQIEHLRRVQSDRAELMLRHCAVSLVVDPVDRSAIFRPAHNAPEVDNCAGFISR